MDGATFIDFLEEQSRILERVYFHLFFCLLNAWRFLFPVSQKLEDLEKEEELKERAGEYDSDDESEDEEMQEIRVLAKQIREKKQLLVAESKEKDVHGPRMPRTATKVRGSWADVTRQFQLNTAVSVLLYVSAEITKCRRAFCRHTFSNSRISVCI